MTSQVHRLSATLVVMEVVMEGGEGSVFFRVQKLLIHDHQVVHQ